MSIKIAVIGGGLSGLCVAKYAINAGHQITIFEQTDNIGGTWNYTDAVGTDEYGLDIHSSMYHNLRTNLPKEIMEFRDYPIPASSTSYIPSEEFLSYLTSYAQHFDLIKLIKFKHHVIRVRPVDDTKWELIVKNLPTNRHEVLKFDALFVCNGHNSVPSIPKFDGIDQFEGKIIHSHDYRRASAFKDKTVLIIGSGPSGIDLTYAISETATKILFSHHTHNNSHVFPLNVLRKGSIKRFTGNSVIFADDTEQPITDVVYCTGYKVVAPFLSVDSGISIDQNYIYPLWKFCININYPTMAFIGLPFTAAITQMIDIQVRFCLHYLNGDGELPTKTDMLSQTKQDLDKRLALGWPKKKGHSIAGAFHREYYTELANIANIQSIREVYLKIYEDSSDRRLNHPNKYRNDIYRIIDDEHFESQIIDNRR